MPRMPPTPEQLEAFAPYARETLKALREDVQRHPKGCRAYAVAVTKLGKLERVLGGIKYD